MRVFYLLLPVWGAIVGFVLGAELVATVFGEGFLATTAAGASGSGWASCSRSSPASRSGRRS